MSVTVYSTPTCPFCKQAKMFLSEHQVPFTDIDVSADPKAAEALIEKSGQTGVPVLVLTGDDGQEQVVIGFNKKELQDALGIRDAV
jgi:glutaredoxin-like YruB-family protein